MSDYIKVKAIDENQVDKYLNNGWEIIDTVKTSYDGNDARLDYHIGLPSRVVIDMLTGVIREYEKHGFKELLFEKVAEGFGENVSDYEEGGGRPSYDKTPSYIEDYELTVNNSNVSIYKKVSFSTKIQVEDDLLPF